MVKRLIAALLILTAPVLQAGLMEDFGPFAGNEDIVGFTLQPCTPIQSVSSETKIVEDFAVAGHAGDLLHRPVHVNVM